MFEPVTIEGQPPVEKKDKPASKSKEAQEIMDAPHTEVIKATIRGECEDKGGIAGKRLLSFIDRIERLTEEKTAIEEDLKEVYAEAKGVGFEVTIIRKLIAIRKLDTEKRRETEELLELYKAAIGMK